MQRPKRGYDRKRCPVTWLGVHVLLLCIAALAVGCNGQKEMADPKAALEEVAQKYWTKRFVEKDYEFTYDLELEKDSIPFSEYVKQVKRSETFKISSVETKEVRIDGDRGEVFLTVNLQVPDVPKELSMAMPDLWLWKSNTWKHKFSDK